MGDLPLKEEYPRLYQASIQKTNMVNEVRGEKGIEEVWELQFRRVLFACETEQYEALKLRLQGVNLDPFKDDQIKWRWSNDGKFTVKSAYDKWESITHSSNELLGSRWKNLGLPKVEIFTWLAVKERTVTRSMLLSRNLLQGIEEASCPFCN